MPQMWGRVGESRCNLLDGLRMKLVSLYFNKGVILLLSLSMQMEAFAQRGRAIPQDWGGGGGSYSHDGGDLFYYIICAIILVFYIVFKIQSINYKNKQKASTSTEAKATNEQTTTPNEKVQYDSNKPLTPTANRFNANQQRQKDKEGESDKEVFAKIGTEMSISAFVAFHGDYEIKLSDDSTHYLQAKDGTCAYIVQELEDLFEQAKKKGEAFKLDEVKLKVRKYYSKEDNEIKYKAYYNYKGKE